MSGMEALAMPGAARKTTRPGGNATGGWTSLPGMLFALARKHPDRPMLRHWRDGSWQRLAWGDFALQVARAAAWLRAQGIMPGDRVMLVSESRPEWNVADAAIMAIGAVTVPTYTTNTVADHAHILGDSGARAAIVSSAALTARVAEALPRPAGSTCWSASTARRGPRPAIGRKPWPSPATCRC